MTASAPTDDPLARASVLTAALASDALDALGMRDQAVACDLPPLALNTHLVGYAVPVSVLAVEQIPLEPYTCEMRAIEHLGPGDVPVYSVRDGVRAALFGELFSLAARERGAVGAIVDGRVRDVRQLVEVGFPVFARGRSTLDTLGRAEVASIGDPVVVGGVEVHLRDLVVADDDGIVIVPRSMISAVLDHVNEKIRGERGARDDIISGDSVREVWDRWRVF